MDSRSSLRQRLGYAAWLLLFALVPNLALVRLYERSDHTVEVREKLEHYLRAPGEWNLLFLGDSRTYTDFDPERVDSLLGTRSLNLAFWGHWFPTQYASFTDIAPHVPPGTVVVWSIGEQNFNVASSTVNLSYPVKPWDVPRYVRWGYALTSLQDNVASGILDVLPVHALREPLHRYALAKLLAHAPTAAAGGEVAAGATASDFSSGVSGLGHAAEYQRLHDLYAADPAVSRVRPWIDRGGITSVEVITKRGHYTRIELDSLYFREKQHELAARVVAVIGEDSHSRAYWNTFVGALDLFERNHVRLVVNQVEEAPYQYAVGSNRARSDAFMGRVRAEVERHGFPYLCVDWQRLSDADYFDYNHLNQRGVERFTPMFAAALRPYLR